MCNSIILNNKFELIDGKIKYKITGIIFDDASIDVLNLPKSFYNALKTYNINTLSKFFMMDKDLFRFINGYHKFSSSTIEDVSYKINKFLNDVGNKEKINTLSLNANRARTINDFFDQEDYITKEYIAKNKDNKELIKLIDGYLKRRKIFMYKPGEYITKNGLYKLGYADRYYKEFIELCKEKTINEYSKNEYEYHKPFTFKYIKSLGVHLKIFDLGLDDIFYEGLLKNSIGIHSIKIGDSYLFKFMYDDLLYKNSSSYIDKEFTPTFALRSIIKENNIYDVDELNKCLKEKYFVNVDNKELLKHLINKY